MDVRPVGGGPAGTDLPKAGPVARAADVGAASPAGNAQAATPLDAAILSALSEPDLARLMAILEPSQTPQNITRVNELFQAVMAAAAAGDIGRTLDGITQLAGLDPSRAEAIRTETPLEPFRPEVDSLFTRLTNVAKLDAQSRLGHATQIVEGSRLNALPDSDARPGTLLLIASRLLEAGGYVNAVRAGQVAQLAADDAHWAPAAAAVSVPHTPGFLNESEEASGLSRDPIVAALHQSWTIIRSRAPGRMAALWRRAPLLLLLAVWLAAGTVCGLASWVQQRFWPEAWPSWLNDAGFTVWALGFLALVLFGFYMRVRNVRL